MPPCSSPCAAGCAPGAASQERAAVGESRPLRFPERRIHGNDLGPAADADVLPAGDPVLTMTTGIVMAGVLCASGFALLILPQAALAFSVPLLAGSFVAHHRARRARPKGLALASAADGLRAGHGVRLRPLRPQPGPASGQQNRRFASRRTSSACCSRNSRRTPATGSGNSIATAASSASPTASPRLRTSRGSSWSASPSTISCARSARSSEPDPRRAPARHRAARDLQRRRAADHRWPASSAIWRLTGKPTFDEFGDYAGYIGTASDVTAEKNSERRINYLAHNDALTGLLNRAKFTEHLKQCGGAARALRHRLSRCSISISISSRRSTTAAAT